MSSLFSLAGILIVVVECVNLKAFSNGSCFELLSKTTWTDMSRHASSMKCWLKVTWWWILSFIECFSFEERPKAQFSSWYSWAVFRKNNYSFDLIWFEFDDYLRYFKMQYFIESIEFHFLFLELYLYLVFAYHISFLKNDWLTFAETLNDLSISLIILIWAW